MDSYDRLFGEPNRPFTPAKNHMKSSIPIGADGATKNGNKSMSENTGFNNTKDHVNGNGVASLSSLSDSGSSKSKCFYLDIAFNLI